MLSTHTTYGKLLIIMGYILGLVLFACMVSLTWSVGLCWMNGRLPSGAEMNTGYYIGSSILVVVMWAYAILVLWVSHLLRTRGSQRLCRNLSIALFIFVPFGTVFGVLTHIFLQNQQDQKQVG